MVTVKTIPASEATLPSGCLSTTVLCDIACDREETEDVGEFKVRSDSPESLSGSWDGIDVWDNTPERSERLNRYI